MLIVVLWKCLWSLYLTPYSAALPFVLLRKNMSNTIIVHLHLRYTLARIMMVVSTVVQTNTRFVSLNQKQG